MMKLVALLAVCYACVISKTSAVGVAPEVFPVKPCEFTWTEGKMAVCELNMLNETFVVSLVRKVFGTRCTYHG